MEQKIMIDYYKFAIPGIVVVIIGGMISGIMAYNFYPEKHVNVNIDDGKCYELLDSANAKYQNLAAKNKIEILKLQLDAINSEKEQAVILPVTFSGTQAGISDFTDKYNIINIISDTPISDNSNVDKRIVKATITKSEFQRIVNDLTLKDVKPLSKTVAGSIGLQPNTYITPAEGKQISLSSNDFMREGIHEIVESNYDGVKSAECRTKIEY
ncbi:MAG TPA: hypothetical protein VE445_00925 [Nitrososphaeraceae archaeon]|jgi:hypothetical protein|nr:hypothetical protein [Nitrososphaeraceae archaeon]